MSTKYVCDGCGKELLPEELAATDAKGSRVRVSFGHQDFDGDVCSRACIGPAIEALAKRLRRHVESQASERA